MSGTIPSLALGMNLPFVEYYDHVDLTYDLGRRALISAGQTSGTTQILALGQPYDGTKINASLDGAVHVDPKTNTSFGTLKMDWEGRIYPVNSTSAAVIQFNIPYYVEPGRGRNLVLDLGFNLPAFRRLSASLQSSCVRDGSDPNKWHITIPAGYSSQNWFQIDIASIPSTGMNPRLYVDDGIYDPNRILTLEEAGRLGGVASHLRFLNVRHINSDALLGDTYTAFQYRNPGEFCQFPAGGIWSPADCARACNEAGAGIWYQVSHRDSFDAITWQAQQVAQTLVSDFAVIEHSNEPWNLGFSQTWELMCEGLRLGYSNPNISYSADATPLSYPIYYVTSANQYNLPGHLNNSSNTGPGLRIPLNAGDHYFAALNGYGGAVLQAQQAMAAGADLPVYYAPGNNGWPSLTFAVGDHILYSDKIYVCVQANTGQPATNTAYFVQATPANANWMLTFTNAQGLTAARRLHATRSVYAWQAFDDAFANAGKARPRHAVNLQCVSTIAALSEMLPWDDFYLHLDGQALAPYLGAVAGVNVGSFSSNVASGWAGAWTPADRAALYDDTVDANLAVADALDKFFDPAVIQKTIDAAIATVTANRAAVQQWYDTNHPEVGKTAEVWAYEQAWAGVFSGWPDQAAAFSITASYTAGAYATKSGTTYRALVDCQGIDVSDSNTWRAIGNATMLDTDGNSIAVQRAVALFAGVMRDSRFGDWSYAWDQAWANNLGRGYVTKFDAQNDMPTVPAKLSSWGHRERTDDVTAAAWMACGKTHQDWGATLGALSLANSSANAGDPWSSAIVGANPHSTLSASAADGTLMTINGTTVSGTFPHGGTIGVTITETLPGAVNSPKANALTVSVAGTVVLNDLALSDTNPTAGKPWSATISGLTSGSAVTVASSDGTSLTVTGSVLSGTFNTYGAVTVTLTESLGGATNTPHVTTIPLRVFANGTLGTLGLYPLATTTGQAWTGTISGQTPGSTMSASSSDGTPLTVSGSAVSGTFGTAGSPTITLVETLAGALRSPQSSSFLMTATAPLVLKTISTASTQAYAGVAFKAQLDNVTAGSTIQATSDDGSLLTVTGDILSGTFLTAGARTVTLVETKSDGPNSPHTSVITINAAAGIDSDLMAYLNAIEPQFYTRQVQLGTLVAGLKADGVWGKLDWLMLHAADGQNAALTNLAKPTKTLAIVGSGGTFTGAGYAGDGSSSYLTIAEGFAKSGNKFSTSTGAAIGSFQSTTGTGRVVSDAGGDTIPRTASATSISVLLANSAGSSATSYTVASIPVRHVAGTRANSASQTRCFNQGVHVGDSGVTTTGSATGPIMVGRSGGIYGTARVAAWYSGGLMTDGDIASLHDRLSTYLAAIGAISPVLNALSPASANSFTGVAYKTVLNGVTAGSTIQATSDDGSAVKVDGNLLSGKFTTSGARTITLVETKSGMPNSPRTSTITINADPGLDPDLAAYLNLIEPQFYARQNQLATLAGNLKGDGVWGKLDWLMLHAGDGYFASATNLLDPMKTLKMIGSGGSFTAAGYAGDGSSSYLTIGEPFAKSGNKFSPTAGASIGAFQSTTGSGRVVSDGSGDTVPRTASATTISVLLCNTPGSVATSYTVAASPVRHVAGTRMGGTNSTRCFDQGVYVGDNGLANMFTSTSSISIGKSGGLYNTARVSAWYSGGVLTDADVAAMQGRLAPYLAAIGAI